MPPTESGHDEGSSSPRRSRSAVLLLQVLVASLLLFVILRRVDWHLLHHRLLEVRLEPFALAVFGFALIAVLEILRLGVALAAFRPTWLALTRLHVIGAFFGSFLPGQVGADLYKIHALSRLDKDPDRPLALILLLRVLGLGVLLAAVFGCLALYGDELSHRLAARSLSYRVSAGLVGLVVAGLLVVALLVARPRVLVDSWARLGVFRIRAGEALRTLGGRNIAMLTVLTGLTLLARIVVIGGLVAAVGKSLSTLDLLFATSAGTLATLLPISFAGLGLREGTVVGLLVYFQVPYEEAVLVALTERALIFGLAALGGGWWIFDSFVASDSARIQSTY